ncbi:MAG: hypothetical protein JW742_07600 [Candidatus Aminicenantes bacterium]|nr:hypothetical protein [Candidatus Aminicenantes bacterium]
MNEIDELSKLDVKALPALKPGLLDDLHQKVLKNLHLELGAGPVLYLFSPSFSVLNPEPDERVGDFLVKKEALLAYLKEALVQSLAVYSVLLDVNSYFVEQNSHLVLARLQDKDAEARRFEVKYYTHAPHELLSHYEDKIYIGRDFIDLFNFRRKHFGVRELIESLSDQNEVLIDRAQSRLKNALEYKSYFQEIKESVGELAAESRTVLESLPPHIDPAKCPVSDLIDINAQYRALNHFVIELHDAVAEFENLLRFRKEAEFVRYVTKYKKDVTNLISYFNIRVNGDLSRRILESKARHG